jgi:hypothetical protein
MNTYYCSCINEDESYLFLLFDCFIKLGNLFGLIYFLVQCNAVDRLVSYLRNESNDTWVNITQYKDSDNNRSDSDSDRDSRSESDKDICSESCDEIDNGNYGDMNNENISNNSKEN